MSFRTAFEQCLSPLPPPNELFKTATEVAQALAPIGRAYTATGAGVSLLLSTLLQTGAIVGVDEAAMLAALGAAGLLSSLTVHAYIHKCAFCLAKIAVQEIWDAIDSCTDSYVSEQLILAANEAGISNPNA